jgi:WD40 repeat protein
MRILTIDQGRFRSVAFTTDGSRLVALDSWGTLHFWDTVHFASWLRLVVPAFWSDPRLLFSPDGRHCILGGRVWDLSALLGGAESESPSQASRNVFSGAPVLQPHCLAFEPSGQIVARCAREAPVTAVAGLLADLELLDLKGDKVVACDSPGYVNKTLAQPLVFAPDGRLLAGTQVNYSVRLWDAGTGEELAQLEHTEHVHAVAYAPNGRVLATAAEGVLRLWDPRSFRCLKEWRPFQRDVGALAFHPSGRALMAGSQDGTIKIWDFPSFRETAMLDWQIGAIGAVAIAPHGMTAAAIGDKPKMAVWDLEV